MGIQARRCDQSMADLNRSGTYPRNGRAQPRRNIESTLHILLVSSPCAKTTGLAKSYWYVIALVSY